jgi:uncharacterized protein
LADEGFKQISVEPVVGDCGGLALRKEDLPQLFAEYTRLAGEIVSRKNTDEAFNFFHFNIDLEGGPCLHKRISGCGAGNEYLAVTVDGDLYPCHQLTGTEFLMGSIWDGITVPELRDEFAKCNVYTKKACADCWAKFYCGGGCCANGYAEHGSIYALSEIGCEMQRFRTECAVAVLAESSAV